MARKTEQRRIACADCETDPFEYGADINPFVWGYYDGVTYAYFWAPTTEETCKEFIDFLKEELDENGPFILYAHNGGKFDFLFLLKYFDQDVMLINGRVAVATLFNGGVELRDSYLILPIALREVEKDDIEYWKMKKEHRQIYKNEIIRYLKKDCSSLYLVVSKFIERFGPNLTLASTAFKEIKKTGYEITGTSERFDTQFRNFYFGGRVQCFKTGAFKTPMKYYDINSAYPKAMCANHWYGGAFIEQKALPEGDNGSWFAEITAISRGALPCREEKLFFHTDTVPRTYFAGGWEINAGIKTGTLDIISVKKVYRPALKNNFSTYIDKYFAEKAAFKEAGLDNIDNKIGYIFAKLMQNSGYGKLAQDGRRFQKFAIVPYGEWPAPEKGKPEWEWYSDTDTGCSFFQRPEPSDKFFNVATAASITSYVRAFLWETICGSKNPIYCDTDSLICESFTGKTGNKIGEWSLVDEIEEAYIAQRKMYALLTSNGEYLVASKGVRLTFDQIKNGVESRENFVFKKESPAFSVKHGARYFTREINFKNIDG